MRLYQRAVEWNQKKEVDLDVEQLPPIPFYFFTTKYLSAFDVYGMRSWEGMDARPGGFDAWSLMIRRKGSRGVACDSILFLCRLRHRLSSAEEVWRQGLEGASPALPEGVQLFVGEQSEMYQSRSKEDKPLACYHGQDGKMM